MVRDLHWVSSQSLASYYKALSLFCVQGERLVSLVAWVIPSWKNWPLNGQKLGNLPISISFSLKRQKLRVLDQSAHKQCKATGRPGRPCLEIPILGRLQELGAKQVGYSQGQWLLRPQGRGPTGGKKARSCKSSSMG